MPLPRTHTPHLRKREPASMASITELALDINRRRLYALRQAVEVYTEVGDKWVHDTSIPPICAQAMAVDLRNDRILLHHTTNSTIRAHDVDSLALTPVFRTKYPLWGHHVYLLCDDRADVVYVADCESTVTVLRAKDLSTLRVVEFRNGHPDSAVRYKLNDMAIDPRGSLLICSGIQRVVVLSLPDLVIHHTIEGSACKPTPFICSTGMCVDNQSRIIVGDRFNAGLYAFTRDYELITYLKVDGSPNAVVFDPVLGVFTYCTGKTLHRIPANTWLPGTLGWTLAGRQFATEPLKRTVEVVTALRSLEDTPLSLIPNEVLFLIFEFL